MSTIDYLHRLREFELERALSWFPVPGGSDSRCSVLEIGAGTGFQAKFLANRGFSVTAVDVASSAYREQRVYPVRDYDGQTLPVESASFQVVFSSNVLEHVRDIDRFLDEIGRVIVPGGVAIHILPTPAWRFWSIIGHYGWLFKRLLALAVPRRSGSSGVSIRPPTLPRSIRAVCGTLFPLRHGERGTTVTELYFYSKRWWARKFASHGYALVATMPTGIFYTEGNVFGERLSLACRHRLSRILGSTCRIYVLRRGN